VKLILVAAVLGLSLLWAESRHQLERTRQELRTVRLEADLWRASALMWRDRRPTVDSLDAEPWKRGS